MTMLVKRLADRRFALPAVCLALVAVAALIGSLSLAFVVVGIICVSIIIRKANSGVSLD